MCKLSILLTLAAFTAAAKIPPAEIRYEWKYANFTWPSSEAHDQAIANGAYVPKHNIVSGIKVWKDKFYVTVPRLRPGVPVTLATIPYEPVDGNKSPNLDPYPNWAMQKADDCAAFHHVQSMEIDPAGRMWVINTGRIDILANPKALCPHRLVIFDLEDNGKVLLNHEFPEDVAHPKTAYLNDIVLDHRHGGYAYISNSDNENPSIIVFSLSEDTSWQKPNALMKVTDPNFSVSGDDTKVTTPIPVDGIAMSPASYRFSEVYFSPMSSKKIYRVAANQLRRTGDGPLSDYLPIFGWETGWHSDGMIVNAYDELFWGRLESNEVMRAHNLLTKAAVNRGRRPEYEVVSRDDEKLQWPDTFAIDDEGNVWVTSDRMHRLAADVVNVDEVNSRLVRLTRTECKSYQYYRNGSAPEMPVIPRSS